MAWYTPWTWGTDIVNSINIPQGVQIVFEKIGAFLDQVMLFALSMKVLLIVLLFFAMVIFIFWAPIKLYPLYKKNRKFINGIIKVSKKVKKKIEM